MDIKWNEDFSELTETQVKIIGMFTKNKNVKIGTSLYQEKTIWLWNTETDLVVEINIYPHSIKNKE